MQSLSKAKKCKRTLLTCTKKASAAKTKISAKAKLKAKANPIKAKAAAKENNPKDYLLVLETLIHEKNDEISKLTKQTKKFAIAITKLSILFETS